MWGHFHFYLELGSVGNVWRHFWWSQMAGTTDMLWPEARMLLHTLQYIGQPPPQQRITQPKCQQCQLWETWIWNDEVKEWEIYLSSSYICCSIIVKFWSSSVWINTFWYREGYFSHRKHTLMQMSIRWNWLLFLFSVSSWFPNTCATG